MGTYRYASNTSIYELSAGLMIILWIFLLMVAPGFVLSNFFKEPYSRRASLVGGIDQLVSFVITPKVMDFLITQYAQDQNISVRNALSVGEMAYVAIGCALMVLVIAIYRNYKKDNFE